MSDREKWLNGWHRDGHHVVIEGGVHCAGCGALKGVICFIPCLEPLPPEPQWPFDENECPVCWSFQQPAPKATECPKSVVDAYQLGLKRGAETRRVLLPSPLERSPGH